MENASKGYKCNLKASLSPKCGCGVLRWVFLFVCLFWLVVFLFVLGWGFFVEWGECLGFCVCVLYELDSTIPLMCV